MFRWEWKMVVLPSRLWQPRQCGIITTDHGTLVFSPEIMAMCAEAGSRSKFSVAVTSHFQVVVNLIMKARLIAKLFIWRLVLFAYEWKLILMIKTLHLASLLQWGSKQLANGPFEICLQSQFFFNVVDCDWHTHTIVPFVLRCFDVIFVFYFVCLFVFSENRLADK